MKKIVWENSARLHLYEIILVFIISIFVLFIMTGFNPNVFLVDDNYTAFYPIIQKNYDTFLATGRMPIFNFYQMKGMIVSDQGYYGQTNALLFISYLISKFVFSIYNTLSIYIFLCIGLGNIGLYTLLRKIGFKRSIVTLCILMLMGSSAFMSYGYWYYIFGNYIVIPYLMLSIYICFFEKKSIYTYFIIGLVLFFSICLGNIQYTFYHYMLFGLYFVLHRDYTKTKIFLSNMLVGVVLSIPFIILQMSASTARNILVGNEFLLYPNKLLQQIILSIVPINWLEKLFSDAEWLQSFLIDGSFVGNGYDFYFCGFLVLAVFIYVGIYFWNAFGGDIKALKNIISQKDNLLIKILFYKIVSFLILLCITKKITISLWLLILISVLEFCVFGIKNSFEITSTKKENKFIKNKFVRTIFLCVIFYEILGLGSGYIIADILAHIPVINHFRYLFKTIFVIVPLLPVIAALTLEVLSQINKKIVFLIASALVVLGLYNNYYLFNSGAHRFYREPYLENNLLADANQIQKRCESINVDMHNYRFCTFLENQGGVDYWNHYDPSRVGEKIDRNMPTLVGVYSLGGYDKVLMDKSYYQSSAILILKDFCFSWTNGVASYQFFDRCDKEEGFVTEFIDDVLNNKVKYFLFNENSMYIDKFKDIIDRDSRVMVERETPFVQNMVLIELNGVDSLCDSGKLLPESQMDRIVIETNGIREGEEIRLSFTYYPNIIAIYVNEKENEHLQVMETEDGYIKIIPEKSYLNGKIYILYSDAKRSIVLIYMFGLSAITLVLIIIYPYIYDKKITTKSSKEKI